MASIEVGRVCVKTAGREAGEKCAIVEIIDENFVEVVGEVYGVSIDETHDCDVRINKTVCPPCSKMQSGYYETVIQFRADNREIKAEEYEKADEIVFTNTYTQNTVNPPVQEYDPEPTPKEKIIVKKIWVGDDETVRPDEIEVRLLRNGRKHQQPVELSASKHQSENWIDFWYVSDIEDYKWSVEEIEVPEGYEEFADTLKLMEELAEILRKEKLARGYLDFDAKEAKIIVDDKSKYTDWSTREDIKANLQVDLILLLDEFGYPPVTIDDVYKDVLEQAENFKKYA
mgnify:CR=1 FL=1